jgi:2-hydroxy-3-keto-5-methylthiopentenyl-1-phosphate phosphatase
MVKRELTTSNFVPVCFAKALLIFISTRQVNANSFCPQAIFYEIEKKMKKPASEALPAS